MAFTESVEAMASQLSTAPLYVAPPASVFTKLS